MSACWCRRVFFGVFLAWTACGSASKHNAQSADSPADAEQSTASGTVTSSEDAAKTINNNSYSTKMARQSCDDVRAQSDLSEAASTGQSDSGGTSAPHGHNQDGFSMQMPSGFSFDAQQGSTSGTMSFDGMRMGNRTLSGQGNVVLCQTGDANVSITMDYNTVSTLANGDAIASISEPSVCITKLGKRSSGGITRLIHGTVERKLLWSRDANRHFDLVIDHNNVSVTDTYDGSHRLAKRVINGQSVMQDTVNDFVSTITYQALEHTTPHTCLCPTGGTLVQTISKNNKSETHTYVFGGTCGQSTVRVDGGVDAAAGAQQSNQKSAIGAHAELGWDQCLPSGQ